MKPRDCEVNTNVQTSEKLRQKRSMMEGTKADRRDKERPEVFYFFPSMMPSVFKDFREADCDLKKWAGDPYKSYVDGEGVTVAGGFDIKKVSCPKASKNGMSCAWSCNGKSNDGVKCSVLIRACETVMEGAIKVVEVESMRGSHNHNLTKTQAEANVNPLSRHIPKHLMEVGQQLADSGFGPAEIFRYFSHVTPGELTFTKSDVTNRFRRTTAEIELDATNFADELMRRSEQKGLFSSIETEASGRLKNVSVLDFYLMLRRPIFL
jgi:hypothetical protein